MIDDISWLADGNTLEGKLQRGRGAGFLEAIREPRNKVEPLIVDCIRQDYRWDRQCEDRSEFNAALVIALDIDVSWSLDHLRQVEVISSDDYAGAVTVGALCELARRGHLPSVSLLRDYVAWGNSWHEALRALWTGQGPIGIDGLEDTIRAIAADDEKVEGLEYLDDSLLGYIAGMDDRIAEVLEESRNRHRESIDSERAHESLKASLANSSLSVAGLLEMVNRSNMFAVVRALEHRVTANDVPLLITIANSDEEPRKYAAIKALGYTGAPEAFNFLWEIARDNPELTGGVRGHIIRGMGNFPSWVRLSAAREAFESKNRFLRSAAAEILEACGDKNDIPAALKAIADGMRDSDVYRTYEGLEILRAIEEPVQDEILDEVFAWSPSQFGRNRAADAMEAVATEHYRDQYAMECLWDCSVFTREVGCRHVDIGQPAALERVRAIASDPLEHGDTRQAARERLGLPPEALSG